MARDLKEIFNQLDQKGQIETESDITIRILKEEIEKLKFTIKEQKIMIQELDNKLRKATDIPLDIKFLKDLVISQRQEIKTKENEIQHLEQKLDETKNQFNNSPLTPETYNDYIHLKKTIIEITGENELLKINEANAKTIISDLITEKEKYILEIQKLRHLLNKNEEITSENEKSKVLIENLEKEISSLKEKYENHNHNLLNLQQYQFEFEELNKKYNLLENENDKLKKNLDTAHITADRLVNEIESYLKEIKNLTDIVNERNIKLNVQNEKIEALKRQYDTISKKFTETSEYEKKKYDQFSNKNKELLDQINKLNQDNINLNNVISELLLNQNQLQNDKFKFNYGLPRFYQNNLFVQLYYLLDNEKRNLIFQSLIKDLININNNDIKRSIIDILSSLNDDRVIEIFKKMIFDEDWLVRLYTVKALQKFESKTIREQFLEPLNLLLNDEDVDVREHVKYVLSKLS